MKKIKWIMLALVLCLGLVGGAYAAWTQTLTIDGTVTTASWNHEWQNYVDQGELGVTPWSYIDPHGLVEVGVSYTNPQELVITFTNAYPGYRYAFNVDLVNLSTIRSKVESVTLTASNPGRVSFTKIGGGVPGGIVAGQILEPQGSDFGSFEIKVLDNAEPNGAVYTFKLKVDMTTAGAGN